MYVYLLDKIIGFRADAYLAKGGALNMFQCKNINGKTLN